MYKYLLAVVGGIGIGAVGTYFAVNKTLKDKYEKERDEEVSELKNLYLSKCRKQDEIKKLTEEKEKMMDVINASGYSKVEAETPVVEEEPEDNEESDTDGEAPVEYPDEPYVITPNQFVHEKRYYDKITLLYYEGDGALVSETDDYIEDINSAIGEESLSHFGEWEQDAVYVRNDKLSIDYEVILQHSAYGDTGP